MQKDVALRELRGLEQRRQFRELAAPENPAANHAKVVAGESPRGRTTLYCDEVYIPF